MVGHHFHGLMQMTRHASVLWIQTEHVAWRGWRKRTFRLLQVSFKTDQVLLQHMKDSHKAGKMPYVCRVCNYRLSALAHVRHVLECGMET